MRDIKLRAWDPAKQEMIYDIFIIPNGMVYYWTGNHRDEAGFIKDAKVMEFVGIQDLKGNDIYEGDIVKDVNGVISTIVFQNCMFTGKTKKGMNAYKWRECERIGNIYENRELLSTR